MFYKVVFAVVVSFALTSALPIPGDIGGSLPSPLGEIIKQITDLLDSLNAQLPVSLPEVPELPAVPVPSVPEIPIDLPTIPDAPTLPELPTLPDVLWTVGSSGRRPSHPSPGS